MAKIVSQIPHFAVHSLWPKIEPILSRAVEYDDVNVINAVYTDCVSNNLQLFGCIDDTNPEEFELIVATRFTRGKKELYLDITYVAGKNLKEWYDAFFDVVEEHGRKNNCTMCRFHGRVFLHDHMVSRGWETKKIITYRPIS